VTPSSVAPGCDRLDHRRDDGVDPASRADRHPCRGRPAVL